MTKQERQRQKLYKEWIDSIVLDISLSEHWRSLLSSSNYYQKFLIDSSSKFYFPDYPMSVVREHNLQFYVSKVIEAPPNLADDDCIIFKFESAEFPEIIDYSGN